MSLGISNVEIEKFIEKIEMMILKEILMVYFRLIISIIL